MAARSWQDELARQAEEGSARLREMLSVGLGFLRTELGLDLGLEPKRYPGWVILVGTAALGLLLLCLLGYGWAAACAGARRKRRSPPRRREEAAAPASAPDDLALPKSLRSDEPKKKSRKKLPEKPKVSRQERRAGRGPGRRSASREAAGGGRVPSGEDGGPSGSAERAGQTASWEEVGRPGTARGAEAFRGPRGLRVGCAVGPSGGGGTGPGDCARTTASGWGRVQAAAAAGSAVT